MSCDQKSDAERALDAIERRRANQKDNAHGLARAFFAYLADEFGDEVARGAWTAAPPKRRRGYRVTDEKARQDRLAVLMDETNRELGMTAEQSAERVGDTLAIGGRDPQEVRRTLNRIRSRIAPKSIVE